MRSITKAMRRTILPLILFLTTACRGVDTVDSTAATITHVPSEALETASGGVTALGTILPARRVTVGFQASGPVRAVHVQVGTEVQTGELLAELDTADLVFVVREAEDELALSRALLEQARAGAREQELAIARAGYERALAQHEQMLAGARPEQIAMARADRDAALARLMQVESGADEEELIVSRADLEKAEIALERAQAEYDRYAWREGFEASPQAATLQEATINHRAAKAQYERLTKLPDEADLEAAGARLVSAEAQLKLSQAGPDSQQVTASAATVTIAQAQLQLKEAAPRPEDAAVAEARVRQAQTALERAKLALSRSQLEAPFSGTVSAVHVSAAEWAAPGTPVVELLDTSGWVAETRNVSELDIARVKVGQQALVRVMALGDEELQGRIISISPVAVVQQGDTTYTAIIELEPADLNLRPGMNAKAQILTE